MLKEYKSDKIRNVVILGHLGTGKSTLFDAMLLNGNKIDKIGISAEEAIYLAEKGPENPPLPTSFAMTLRKYLTNGRITSIEQQEFDRQAAHYIQTVVNSTQRYEEYILDLARRFEGPAPMDRWQFDDYSTDRLERYKGLLSLAWIPFVSADRRGEFEAKAHDDGLFGFQIRERGGTGNLVDAGLRDFYLPVYYAVPFDVDREFLGMDIYSLEEFRPALDAAGEGGHPVVVPWSRHGNSLPAPTEFQIIRPVYDSSGSADIGAPRKQRLRGFVAGALRLDTIVESVVDELTTPAWLDIYVYRRNETADTDLLLFRP